MKNISFLDCLLKTTLPLVAFFAILAAAAQRSPAADGALVGGNALPLTFEATVFEQMGTTRPASGHCRECRSKSVGRAIPVPHPNRRGATIRDECR